MQKCQVIEVTKHQGPVIDGELEIKGYKLLATKCMVYVCLINPSPLHLSFNISEREEKRLSGSACGVRSEFRAAFN